MATSAIHGLAQEVVETASRNNILIATAESCTGGLIAASLTDIAGSSAMFDRTFVTYSNEAKADMLGIPMALIEEHGAVSGVIARAMAEGVLQHSAASLAVSVTGIAGPGGGSVHKPVGLVHFGLAVRNGATQHVEMQFGDLGREKVRWASVEVALNLLKQNMPVSG